MGLNRFVVFAAALCACGQPIRVHPANPHYLEWRGKLFLAVSSGEHYGAVLNADFDYAKYLATLQREGMNYTRLFTGAYREVAGDFGIERNTLAPARFLAPWASSGGKFDLDSSNPDYFSRLRAFIAEAEKRGIAVEVTLFCSTYGERQWSASPFNPANNINSTSVRDWKRLHTLASGNVLAFQEKLTRKIVQELNGYSNVIFEIQNEPWADRAVVTGAINPYLPLRWPNTADHADSASLAWQERVAHWIRSEESSLPHRHLIAWNVCNFRSPLKTVLPGADIVNFHYAYPEASLWNHALGMPISYDETGFLGTQDGAYRKQAWRFMLSGGAVFNQLDYSFSLGYEDGTGVQPKSPGGGSPALRRQLRILREFLEQLPVLEMGPALSLVRHSPGAVSQTLAKPGQAYAVYLAGPGPTFVLLEAPRGNYNVEWLNPLDGASAGRSTVSHRGGVLRLDTPAFTEDIALRLIRSR